MLTKLLTIGLVAKPAFSPVLGFFLPRRFAGGDADDGPKVNDRDNDDASTDPSPDPLRD